MRRKLFTLAAGVSAVLCAGVCVLWVRSYHPGSDWLAISNSDPMYFLGSDKGIITLVRQSQRSLDENPSGKGDVATGVTPDFSYLRDSDHNGRIWELTLPHWFAVGLFATIPGGWIVRRFERRSRPGRCPACGYDLRATPDRCPECGAVPAAKGERA